MGSRLLELTLLILAVAVGMSLWAPGPRPTPSAIPALSVTPPWEANLINGISYKLIKILRESLK